MATVVVLLAVLFMQPAYANNVSASSGSVRRQILVKFLCDSKLVFFSDVYAKLKNGTTLFLKHAGRFFDQNQHWKSMEMFNSTELDGLRFQGNFGNGTVTNWMKYNDMFIGLYDDSFFYYNYSVFM